MPVEEASSEETPYGRYITSDGWFVLNLAEALAVRNEEKGGALYPIEAREARFHDFGVNVRVFSPREPNALYHAETGQEGFLVLAGECTLVVEEGGTNTEAVGLLPLPLRDPPCHRRRREDMCGAHDRRAARGRDLALPGE
jgi:hypothetical protein